MKLEDQVVSLELAKKMKELGFKQESLFQWSDCKLNEDENGKTISHWAIFTTDDYGKDPQPPMSSLPAWYDFEDFEYGECVSAYTVAELGEMLPAKFDKDGKKIKLSFNKLENGNWSVKYKLFGYNEFPKSFQTIKAETEADARAKMLIYLKGNKLI